MTNPDRDHLLDNLAGYFEERARESLRWARRARRFAPSAYPTLRQEALTFQEAADYIRQQKEG